jgi:hypothetical protein
MDDIVKSIVSDQGLITFRIQAITLPANTVFAVYSEFQGRLHCFHLVQDPDDLIFKIVDKYNCPYHFRELDIEQFFTDVLFDVHL